jgi:uncharacterized membrane protein
MKKLSTTAKTLDKILNIVYAVFGAFAIAAIVVVAMAGISYALNWETESLLTSFASFDIGFLEIEVAQDFIPNSGIVLMQAIVILIGACAAIVLARKGIIYIRQILKPMAEEKPFDSIVSTNLRKLAKLSVFLGILCNIVILAEQFILVFSYDLRGLLLSDKIPAVDFNFEIDLSFLLSWGILMLLSYVFQYGEQLQQLSDETV